MAIEDVVHDYGAAYVAVESSFGTGGTLVRIFPIAGTINVTRNRENLERHNLKSRQHDVDPRVLALKMPEVAFEHYVQPHATVLTPSASLPSNDGLQVLLNAIFGGVSHKLGSDLTGTPAASGGSVTSMHGERFPDGQLSAVYADSTYGFQAIRITNRNSDALTWYPDLSATPASGADVVNLATYYVSTGIDSLRFVWANAADADHQWSVVGLTGAVELSVEQGGLAKLSFNLQGADYTGPSAIGEDATHGADPLDVPFSCVAPLLYLQPVATTTRANVPCTGYKLSLELGNKHLMTLTGGINGKRGVVRAADVGKPAGSIEITTPADRSFDGYHDNKTALTCMLVLQRDTATGRRFFVVDCARCTLTAPPRYERGPDGMTQMVLSLQPEYDQSTTGSHDNDELAWSPIRFGIG